MLEVVVDAEPRQAASQLRFVLLRAGWKLISDHATLEVEAPPNSGVTIFSSPTGSSAAETLASFLASQNWDVHAVTRPEAKIPPNTGKISINLKPNRPFQGHK